MRRTYRVMLLERLERLDMNIWFKVPGTFSPLSAEVENVDFAGTVWDLLAVNFHMGNARP